MFRQLSGSVFCAILLCLAAVSCTVNSPRHVMIEQVLEEFVEGKDAHIGIAVIIDGKDTIGVNSRERFPMQSVYKFPIALAYARHCSENGVAFDDSCRLTDDDLHRDTYSPMREVLGEIGPSGVNVAGLDLLKYSLQLSDNNASDVLLREAGGAAAVNRFVKEMGIDGMDILWSENEMHIDTVLCRQNSSTPLAMAMLIDRFDRMFTDTGSMELKNIMETCATGAGRLQAGLQNSGYTLFGHKTGTGDVSPEGRLTAVNDAGYVHLPDGRHFTIVVFVEDSAYDMAETESIIAAISEIVTNFLQENP